MALLNIEMVQDSGSFVGKPVKQKIKWSVGDKEHSAEIYVKLSAYDTTIAEFQMQKQGGVDPMVSKIVTAVVDNKGKPIFDLKNVAGDPETGEGKMCASLFIALIGAINRANGHTDEDTDEVVGKK